MQRPAACPFVFRLVHCSALEITVKRPVDKAKGPPVEIPLDIKRDIPEKQLASLGALALAFNEAQATLDGLFYVVTDLPEYLKLEVSTRIGGIDGTLAVVKIGAKPFLSKIELKQLEESLGNSWFSKMKIYRDGVIHCRHVNVVTNLGVNVSRQAHVFEFLIRQDALDAAYNLLEILNRELRAFLNLIAANRFLATAGPDDSKKVQLEATSKAMSSEVLQHRIARLALPPFPEFPTELQLRQAEMEVQKAQLMLTMPGLRQWDMPPHFQQRLHSPALLNILGLNAPPLPLMESQKKK